MTAHARCVRRLQKMLIETARQLEKISERLPEEISSYPLTAYEIDIVLMRDGQTCSFPLIGVYTSSMVLPEKEADGSCEQGQ